MYQGNEGIGIDLHKRRKSAVNITPKALRKLYETYYKPSNMYMVVVGDIKSTHAIKSEILKNFPKRKNDYVRPISPFNFQITQDKPQYRNVIKKKKQVEIAIGFLTNIGRKGNSFYGLNLLTNLLGKSHTGRLWIALREKKGLAYKVHVYLDMYEETSSLIIITAVNVEDVEETIKTVANEIKKISKTNPITSKEFRESKKEITSTLLRESSNVKNVAALLLDQAMYNDKQRGYDDEIKEYKKLTISKLKKLYKIVFDYEHLNIATIGPKSIEVKIKNLMNTPELW